LEKNRLVKEPLDQETYKERKRIEWQFAWVKEFRRVATRYEKLAVSYMLMVLLAMTMYCVRRTLETRSAKAA
jgi:transposase